MAITIFLIVFLVPTFWSLWTIFKQAGYKGWEAVVPGWNAWIWIKVIGKPWWWLLLLFVPFINIFMFFLMLIELSVCFKRNGILEYLAAAILPFLYFPFLLYVKKEHYTAPKDLPPYKKSVFRDWFDSIIFAVLAAMIVRMFFFENYTIPTSSMEKSMLVGDYVYVSKLAYGPRIPQTPLAFPLVHHTLPFSNGKKSYVESVQLKYRRVFSYKKVKYGDAVVFNFPVGDTVATAFQSTRDYYALCREYGRSRVLNNRSEFGDIITRPVDKRENFVKRCVGLPGETLEIRDQQIYINDVAVTNPKNYQFNYIIHPTGMVLSKTKWRELGISNEDISMLYRFGIVPLTDEKAKEVAALNEIERVEKIVYPANQRDPRIFPFNEAFPWNEDNFGPIYIPKKGETIDLSLDILPLYERVITSYEGHDLRVIEDRIFIDNKPAETYTFEMDYYWMMGDNRHNSADSRYWGFVPEDHIVGRASFVWMSLDKDKSFPKNIRWNKMIRWNL